MTCKTFCFLWLQLLLYFPTCCFSVVQGFSLDLGNELTAFEVTYISDQTAKNTRFLPEAYFVRKGIWGSSFFICQMENYPPRNCWSETLVYLVFDCHNKTASSRGLFILLRDRPGSPKYFHTQLLFWHLTFGNQINAESLECAFKKCLNNPAHG